MNATRIHPLNANALLSLVVDLDLQPHRIVPWDRAFTQAYKGKVDVLVSYDAEVASEGVSLELPCVVKLKRVLPRPKKNEIRFNRTNLLLRDGYRCVYCPNGEPIPAAKLTLDHVIPRSQWTGPIEKMTDWENIVACCLPCNQRKRDRTPKQAGMRLLRRPFIPTWLPRKPLIVGANPPALWLPYLGALELARVA